MTPIIVGLLNVTLPSLRQLFVLSVSGHVVSAFQLAGMILVRELMGQRSASALHEFATIAPP